MLKVFGKWFVHEIGPRLTFEVSLLILWRNFQNMSGWMSRLFSEAHVKNDDTRSSRS